MVNLNFSDQIIKSARSVQASVCDFIGCIGVQKYMTVLLCMALLFSSNSHSESAEGGYKLEYKANYDQGTVELNFSGDTPSSPAGLASNTIYSFNLKIGENEYPLTEHNRYTQLERQLKLKDLNYDVYKFPKSELVFSYGLSEYQFFFESLKCVSVHLSWATVWWGIASNFDLQSCFKKVRGLLTQKKYHSIDITGLLLPHIQSEIETMDNHKDLNYNEGSYKHHAFVLMSGFYSVFSFDFKSDDQFHLDHKQNASTYGQATKDYFERASTTLIEAYDKLILSKNILSTTKDLGNSEKHHLLYKAVESFESEQCEDQLPNNLPITLGNPRLAEAAKNLASELCQYNPISFNHRASNPPTKPREYNEHAATGIYQENSTFLPYAFCDKYTCVIHMSETLYYRLSWHEHVSGTLYKDNIDDIREHLLLKSKVPDQFSDCRDYCTISDIDALQRAINILKYKTHSENNDLVSWIIIMYEKQSN